MRCAFPGFGAAAAREARAVEWPLERTRIHRPPAPPHTRREGVGSWHRGRLRDLSPASGRGPAVHDRPSHRGCPLPRRHASSRSRGLQNAGPRFERHRRHGRTARLLPSLAGARPLDETAVGGRLLARPAQTGPGDGNGAGRGRHCARRAGDVRYRRLRARSGRGRAPARRGASGRRDLRVRAAGRLRAGPGTGLGPSVAAPPPAAAAPGSRDVSAQAFESDCRDGLKRRPVARPLPPLPRLARCGLDRPAASGVSRRDARPRPSRRRGLRTAVHAASRLQAAGGLPRRAAHAHR